MGMVVVGECMAVGVVVEEGAMVVEVEGGMLVVRMLVRGMGAGEVMEVVLVRVRMVAEGEVEESVAEGVVEEAAVVLVVLEGMPVVMVGDKGEGVEVGMIIMAGRMAGEEVTAAAAEVVTLEAPREELLGMVVVEGLVVEREEPMEEGMVAAKEVELAVAAAMLVGKGQGVGLVEAVGTPVENMVGDMVEARVVDMAAVRVGMSRKLKSKWYSRGTVKLSKDW